MIEPEILPFFIPPYHFVEEHKLILVRKTISNRVDVFCCFKVGGGKVGEEGSEGSVDSTIKEFKAGCFQTFIEDYYAPWLFKPSVR